ncbi:hypothetical protein ACQCVH_23235 [Bacillus infantis]|uniref:hypothetical protein n=1 Tax=Bacillus infantis TaxID=324767 RepID=UPI003CF2E548
MKKLLLLVTICLVVTIAGVTYENTVEIKKIEELIYHTSTMNIIINEKVKELEPTVQYVLEVENLNEPNQRYSILIDDERVWNLVSESREYFVVVEWSDGLTIPNIEGKVVNLLQIEPLNTDQP